MSPGRGAGDKERSGGRKTDAKTPRAARRQARSAAPERASHPGRGSFSSWAEHSKLAAFLLITLFSVAVHYHLLPMVADVDSFYHLRHAWVYQTQGIFDSSFPWTQYSVVRTYGADLWYGFHILALPLTLLEPLMAGVYLGALLTTITSLLLAFLAFRRLRVRWPIFWVFVFALISSDLLYRLTMLRPHPLSLGFILLLFAYLVTERSRASQAVIFLLAFLFSWNHIALMWLPVLAAGVVTLVRLLHRQPPEWDKLAALFPGLALGVLLRPHPVGALRLAYIQVVKLMVEKEGEVPLRFGIELYPFYWVQFVDQFIPLSILLVLAGGLLVALWRSGRLAIERNEGVAIWASLAMAAFFFVLTFVVARRSHEIFVGFAVIFLALVFCRSQSGATRSLGTRLVMAVGILTLLYAPVRSLLRFDEIIRTTFYPGTFQEVGLWLRENAQPKEIVFHPYWDRFAELFFWNPRNYYINGMDPIFEYAYSPELYWKTHYYHQDVSEEYTCGGYPCLDSQTIGTYETLKNDFNAAYVVLEKRRSPNLNRYLSSAPWATSVVESDTGVVLYAID